MYFHGISIGGTDSALGRVAWLLFGVLLAVLGGSVVSNAIYWRIHALRVQGEIIGVRSRRRLFHTVFRYSLPSGESHEATSVQGSSSLRGRDTGKRVCLQVMPEHPDEAWEERTLAWLALGAGLLAAGLWISYWSLAAWPGRAFTLFMAAGLALYLGYRLPRMMRSKNVQQTIGAWRASGAQQGVEWAASPVRRAEELRLPGQDVHHDAPRSARRRRAGPVFTIAGLVVIPMSYIPAHHLIQLQGSGARTTGTVQALEANRSNPNDPNVFAVVRFTSADGTIVRFVDSSGSNPPSYKVGDAVTVLYAPADLHSAMIDRGLRNWVPVVLTVLLGSVLLGLGLWSLRSA